MFWLEAIIERNKGTDKPLRSDPPKVDDRPRVKLSKGPSDPVEPLTEVTWTPKEPLHGVVNQAIANGGTVFVEQRNED